MQVAKVRASLRHGITMDTSGPTEPTSEIKGSRPFDTDWTSSEQEDSTSDAKGFSLWCGILEESVSNSDGELAIETPPIFVRLRRTRRLRGYFV